MMQDSRRMSYGRTPSTASDAGSRKQSLREMPSYRDEASRALNRRDDLKDLKRRLSSGRDILNADPSTKPWLKFKTSVNKTDLSLDKVREDGGNAYPIDENSFAAAPAPASMATSKTSTTSVAGSGNSSTSNGGWRPRNYSRGSSNSSFNSTFEGNFY